MEPEQVQSPLHEAAYDGDLVRVQACLQQGLPADTRDDKGYTPLLWCCLRAGVGEPLAVAALLLNSGADPDAQVLPQGRSCLQLASQSGNAELVELLLDRGADPSLVADELTPLMFAISCKQSKISRLLLGRGADVTYQLHGKGALNYAREVGFIVLTTSIQEKLDALSPKPLRLPLDLKPGTIGSSDPLVDSATRRMTHLHRAALARLRARRQAQIDATGACDMVLGYDHCLCGASAQMEEGLSLHYLAYHREDVPLDVLSALFVATDLEEEPTEAELECGRWGIN